MKDNILFRNEKSKIKLSVTISLLVMLMAFICILCGCKSEKKEQTTCILDISYENGKITGSVIYDIKNCKDNLNFYLYPNSGTDYFSDKKENDYKTYAKSLEDNFSSVDGKTADDCPLRIFSVSVCGQDIEYELSDDFCFLKIEDLHNIAQIKGMTRIKIDFETNVKEKICDKKDNMSENDDNIINCFYFYPLICDDEIKIPEYFQNINSEFCDYEVRLTLLSTIIPACGFSPCGIKNTGDKTTYFYSEKNVRNFAVSLSENFNVAVRKWGNRSINCYFEGELDSAYILDDIVNILEFDVKRTGEYPYKNFTVYLSDNNDDFYIFPAFCVIGKRQNKDSLLYLLSMAITRQFFGEIIGVGCENGYFAEGFAEFLSSEFFGGNNGKADKKIILKYAESCLNAYKKVAEKQSYKYNGIMKRDNFLNEAEYNAVARKKGLIFFEYLKENTSEKKFNRAIRKFYEKNKFGYASEDNFISAFGGSKRKVKKIFDEIVLKGGEICLQ